MLYRGTGRPSNPCLTLAPRSPLPRSFRQTHTLASTRNSELSSSGFPRPPQFTLFLSWTFLTWIVVIGSSVVMLLWIVIYSYFESSDFNDEVVILFGNVPFWACVLISVVIALGEFSIVSKRFVVTDFPTAPRFLTKSISSSYMPLDRDIVREMWVYGDLKDRLGIKHRRDQKRGDIEGAPMFHQPHARSQSEVSVVYEGGRASTTQRYLDSPPETTQRTRSPPSQPADSWALRQRVPSDTTSPTTIVGQDAVTGDTQPFNSSPKQTMQNLPVSSYEMQARHNQELTNTSYHTVDDDWGDESGSGSQTPGHRHIQGQAL